MIGINQVLWNEKNVSKGRGEESKEAGFLSSPVAGNVLFDKAVLEVNASLKWMPRRSKLMSGTCITKKKNQLSEFTL